MGLNNGAPFLTAVYTGSRPLAYHHHCVNRIDGCWFSLCLFSKHVGLALSSCGCYFVNLAAADLTWNCFAFAPALTPPGVAAAWRCSHLPWVAAVKQERRPPVMTAAWPAYLQPVFVTVAMKR
jgi:hypothetical protein